jgi:hypothetical protein
MAAALHPDTGVPPSTKWSVYAGLYMFVWATATAFFLADILGLLADVIGLPAEFAMVILASPALVIGAATWWAVVERRDAYTYRYAGTFGLVTALLTGLLWTARFVTVWGVDMLVVPIVSLLVLLVLGVAVNAGVLTGLPMMYARRLSRGLAGR